MKKITGLVKSLWPAGVYLLCQIAAVIITDIPALTSGSPSGGSVFDGPNSIMLCMLLYTIVTAAVVFPVCLKKKYIKKDGIDGLKCLPAAAMGIGAFLITSAVLLFFRDTSIVAYYTRSVAPLENAGLLFRIPVLCLTIPLCEELVFRAAMINEAEKSVSPGNAMLFSAVVFALMHFNPVQSAYALVFGLIIGWIYLRSGKLLPCILFHSAFNTSNIIFESADLPSVIQLVSGALLFVLAALFFIKKTKKNGE